MRLQNKKVFSPVLVNGQSRLNTIDKLRDTFNQSSGPRGGSSCI